MNAYQPLPEWVTGHRMAAKDADGDLVLLSTGETDRADFVTSWTGRTEDFRVNSDGTRRQEDLAYQLEEIHRPVLELADRPVAGQVLAVLDEYAPGAVLEFRGRTQLFVDQEMTTTAYLVLLENLDVVGLLADHVLEGAYADGFTAVAIDPDLELNRPGVEEV